MQKQTENIKRNGKRGREESDPSKHVQKRGKWKEMKMNTEMKTEMKHVSFFSGLIETAGYDAQCALLEVKLAVDGKIRRYSEVPEEVWYRFRENASPDIYYRRYICGRFLEG